MYPPYHIYPNSVEKVWSGISTGGVNGVEISSWGHISLTPWEMGGSDFSIEYYIYKSGGSNGAFLWNFNNSLLHCTKNDKYGLGNQIGVEVTSNKLYHWVSTHQNTTDSNGDKGHHFVFNNVNNYNNGYWHHTVISYSHFNRSMTCYNSRCNGTNGATLNSYKTHTINLSNYAFPQQDLRNLHILGCRGFWERNTSGIDYLGTEA